jgi:hypothetical protein
VSLGFFSAVSPVFGSVFFKLITALFCATTFFYAIFLGFFLRQVVTVVSYMCGKLATNNPFGDAFLFVPGMRYNGGGVWFNPSIIVAFIHENSKSSYAQNLFCFQLDTCTSKPL